MILSITHYETFKIVRKTEKIKEKLRLYREYNMRRTTVSDLIYYQHLPGYKIGGHLYIDKKIQ